MPHLGEAYLYALEVRLTILRDRSSPKSNALGDPEALALRALVWVLAEDDRAQRLLSLTGLTPEALRVGVGDAGLLGAVLDFLCAHEPDLVTAAESLGVAPKDLVEARERLAR
ncbi:MAG: DUF3572 domain-containing protein [Novosphingobium sp.]